MLRGRSTRCSASPSLLHFLPAHVSRLHKQVNIEYALQIEPEGYQFDDMSVGQTYSTIVGTLDHL